MDHLLAAMLGEHSAALWKFHVEKN
jgi:hypothetical protein